MIPMRFLFRSRWAALAWSGCICWTAVSFAGGDHATIDAAASSGTAQAQVSALLAEDNE